MAGIQKYVHSAKYSWHNIDSQRYAYQNVMVSSRTLLVGVRSLNVTPQFRSRRVNVVAMDGPAGLQQLHRLRHVLIRRQRPRRRSRIKGNGEAAGDSISTAAFVVRLLLVLFQCCLASREITPPWILNQWFGRKKTNPSAKICMFST